MAEGSNNLSSMREEVDFIPDALYTQIVKCLPIVSVEGLIVIDGVLLFLRRNNEPVKGLWWFCGGRIRKGESLEAALRREVKEETGLEIVDCELINVYSRVFPQRHDIAIVYLCRCKKAKITLNNEHSEFALFRSAPAGLHPYMLEVMKDYESKKHHFCT